MYDAVVKKFTFAISSPDEFLVNRPIGHRRSGDQTSSVLFLIGTQQCSKSVMRVTGEFNASTMLLFIYLFI